MAPRPLRSGARPHTLIATGLAAALGLVLPAAAQAGPLSRALDNLAAHQDRFGGGFSVGSGTDPNDTAWADPGGDRRGRAGGALARGARIAARRDGPPAAQAHAGRHRAHGRRGQRGGARPAEDGRPQPHARCPHGPERRRLHRRRPVHHGVGDPGAARRRAPRRLLLGAPREERPRGPAARGRRVVGRREPAGARPEHHVGRRPGARGRGEEARARGLAPPGARVPSPRAEPRRRVPGGGGRREHGPHDRVGDRRAAHAGRPAGPSALESRRGSGSAAAAPPAARRGRAQLARVRGAVGVGHVPGGAGVRAGAAPAVAARRAPDAAEDPEGRPARAARGRPGGALPRRPGRDGGRSGIRARDRRRARCDRRGPRDGEDPGAARRGGCRPGARPSPSPSPIAPETPARCSGRFVP